MRYKSIIWGALVAVIFLTATHILFTISAPFKCLEAVWGAGDLISFMGTVSLGIVAWHQNRQANETNERLNKLQKAEYTPTLLLTEFIGITKFNVTPTKETIENEIVVTEMRTEDNEVGLGYALIVKDSDFSLDEKISARTYELHFLYSGKSIAKTTIIKNISFSMCDWKIEFPVNKAMGVSLIEKQELLFFVNYLSNREMDDNTSNLYKAIHCNKIQIEFEFFTLADEKTTELLTINKHYIEGPDKAFPDGKTERLVGASFEIK